MNVRTEILGVLITCLAIPACSSEDSGGSVAAGGSGPEGTAGAAGSRGGSNNAGGGSSGPDATVGSGGSGQSGGTAGSGGAAAVDAGQGDGPTCPSPVATDAKANDRTACTFKAGAMPLDTIGISPQERTA